MSDDKIIVINPGTMQPPRITKFEITERVIRDEGIELTVTCELGKWTVIPDHNNFMAVINLPWGFVEDGDSE